MNQLILFQERHNFFKQKDYLVFLCFLLVVAEKSNSFFMTLIVNTVYALLYFLLIWLIDKKPIVINQNMVSRNGKRLPMKLIQHIVHNGQYLYLRFESNQYIKVYDPKKKLSHLILYHQKSLHLSEQTIKHLSNRVR